MISAPYTAVNTTQLRIQQQFKEMALLQNQNNTENLFEEETGQSLELENSNKDGVVEQSTSQEKEQFLQTEEPTMKKMAYQKTRQPKKTIGKWDVVGHKRHKRIPRRSKKVSQ